MTPAIETYVRAWLNKADHDLITAQRVLEIEPMILDTACFHCQQAVEKYLKGFLAYHNKEIERTHDIIFLLSLCSKIDTAFSEVEPLNINAYAVQGRYPDDNLVPEATEAKSYYQLALDVRALVIERIIFT